MRRNYDCFPYVPCLLAAMWTACIAGALTATEPDTGEDDRRMRRSALAFLESLSAPLREDATFAMDDPERMNWHFVPKERQGVSLGEMNVEQRLAAHALMRAALSSQGYLKATAVMSLESVLRQLEADRPDVEEIRDPEKYWFAIFGGPGADAPWGWRVEGHHLSLNFSSATGKIIATTPSFYGANPGEVRQGPRAGLRVLAREEDLARAIVSSATPEQLERAVIAEEAPREVITVPEKSIDLGQPVGLTVADMSEAQKKLLRQLVHEFAHNLRHELADHELAAIKQAGVEHIHFAWAGSVQPGEPHYYRVHGPTFIIEYDNTQNDANHIHTVWHSLENDFGLDFLRHHYQQEPHDHKVQ